MSSHEGQADAPDEVARITEALTVHEQFPWLQDHDIYAGLRKARQSGQQSLFRVDPVEALWSDSRVAMSYRRLLRFDDAGLISEVHDYPAAGGCPPAPGSGRPELDARREPRDGLRPPNATRTHRAMEST